MAQAGGRFSDLENDGGMIRLGPSKVVVKSPESFTLRTGRRRIELVFSTLEEAARALQLVKSSMPPPEVVYEP